MSRHDKRPRGLKPVTRIALSDKHVGLRMIGIILLVFVAAGALWTGLRLALGTEPGWQKIEAEAEKVNVSTELVLNYDFSASGASASAHKRLLTELFTQAVEDAYRIFDVSGAEMFRLNAAVNETVSVDPVLYDALSMLAEHKNRHVFLAPVYTEYKRMFLSETPAEAALYDPLQNEELYAYVSQAAAFANDPDMIHLELHDDNRAGLFVAEAYLDFAAEHEITEFVDLDWLRNAFVVDHIAELLLENGYTAGYLASYDGFTRNLDKRDVTYSVNLFDRLENEIFLPYTMDYTGPLALINLRNYPMGEQDQWHYASLENDRIATVMIDPADGKDKSSTDNLLSYSSTFGCAEQLLMAAPLYVADELNEQALWEMAESGVYAIWFEGTKLCHTEEDVVLKALQEEVYSIR